MTGSAASPTISVVIPTYRRRDRLPILLDALADEAAAEILVVVNGADDGSLEMLRERAQQQPNLRPLSIEEAGQVLALQAGVERASGDVVLMLDDDVIPEAGLVAGHAESHRDRQNLVVVGYMPVAAPQPRRRGQYPVDLYSRAYERVCVEYEHDPSKILRGLWAGNVSIRRDDCIRIGLSRAERSSGGYEYHEDRDLGLRCEAAGLHAVFDRRLRARHLYERTPESFLRTSRNSGASRAAVHRQHAETVGSLADDFFQRVVPQPGRTFVRLARFRALYRPVRGLLRLITAAAGALHLFRLESHVGYVLGTVEQQRGAMAGHDGETG